MSMGPLNSTCRTSTRDDRLQATQDGGADGALPGPLGSGSDGQGCFGGWLPSLKAHTDTPPCSRDSRHGRETRRAITQLARLVVWCTATVFNCMWGQLPNWTYCQWENDRSPASLSLDAGSCDHGRLGSDQAMPYWSVALYAAEPCNLLRVLRLRAGCFARKPLEVSSNEHLFNIDFSKRIGWC